MDEALSSLADENNQVGTAETVAQDVGLGAHMFDNPASKRTRIIAWGSGILAAVLVAGIAGGIFVKVPYAAIVPGSARDTEPLLAVEGIDNFPSDGELLFTTVQVRLRPNFWEYLWLQTDDDAEIVPEEVLLGDRTAEENREFNLDSMNDSKLVAVAVALEQLGYDAVQTDAVVIQQLVAGEAAEGILVPGDSVLSIDGEPTPSTDILVDTLSGYMPGDKITLVVEHFGIEEVETIEVVLGKNPDEPERAFLGVQPADRLTFESDFGFEVEIDSGEVGGPSAGLAFSLAVLDQMTEGELTGGEKVAVTGTINASGQVGPVGGVVQKTAAVRDLGVEIFLVPNALGEEELDKVRAKAGDDLKVVAVDTIEDALVALRELGGDVDVVDEFAAANSSVPAE